MAQDYNAQIAPSSKPTHRRVLKIALPMVLSNATVPILGAVDTGVIGQLGDAALIGAVGIGAVILAAVYWVFGFLRMGTTGLVSQAYGANDQLEVSVLLTRALLIALAGGLAIIILQAPLIWLAFEMAPASQRVEEFAQSYISIRVYSAPFAIALYGLTGWLIALERSKAVLVLQIVINGTNVVLDFWFVLGLGWGVEGVAFATVTAEIFGFFLALYLCRDAFKGPNWKNWPRVFDKERLLYMLKLNANITVRSVLLLAVMISFAFLGARQGDDILAANHILMQFIEITAFALDGFAFSAEVIVGQAVGAKARDHLRQGVVLSFIWAGIASLILASAFLFFGPHIVAIMASAQDVRASAAAYLPWMALAPIVGVVAWIMDGVFIGATRSADMRNMMILSTLIYLVAVLILLPLYGNHGLWGALLISYGARGLSLLSRYPSLERSL